MSRRVATLCLLALSAGCDAQTATGDVGTDAARATDVGLDAAARDAGLDAPTTDAGRDGGFDAAVVTDAGPPDTGLVATAPLEVPDGGAIGADDIVYGHRIGRVLLPTGQALQLYDPIARALTVVSGFGGAIAFDAGTPHGVAGTTSADDGTGVAYAIDRRSQSVAVVDVASGAIASWAPLAAQPDIVRYASSTRELWVTEPSAIQIEVFTTSSGGAPTHAAFVPTALGCEALAIDEASARAYTNSGANTLGIDLISHALVTSWPNGCVRPHGLAIDARGFLVVDCNEGHLQVLDTQHGGAQLSQLAVPTGTDLIDLDPSLAHVYVAAMDGTLTVASLDATGTLSLLGTLMEGAPARAAASDGAGHVYLVDAVAGRLVVVTDPYPSSL